MYENITGIQFKGAAFLKQTNMPFFPQNGGKKNRICVTYGKNGSGKSTIAKAMLKLKGKDIPEIHFSQCIDSENRPVLLSEEAKNHLFVFNESYIEQNVRFKDNGLDTIVMLGGQVDLDDKIAKAEKEYGELLGKKENQEIEYNKYMGAASILSPEYYLLKINIALKGDNHWAGRERAILKLRQNAPVKDSTHTEIVALSPEMTQEELKKQYDKELASLLLAADESNKINKTVPVDVKFKHTEEEILELLAMKLEQPELSEREKYLLSLIEGGKTAQLDDMKTKFSDDTTDKCPFCLQSVSPEYKASLIESIEKVLSKEAEEHRRKVMSVQLSAVNIDLESFRTIDSNAVEKCQLCLEDLNCLIQEINNTLNQKANNVYSPILDKKFSLESKRKELIQALTELESLRMKYNEQFDGVSNKKKHLQLLNKQLSYFDICEFYSEYQKQSEEKRLAKEKLDNLVSDMNLKKKDLDDLLQQKKNIKIAVSAINQSLQYVFFSNKRLQIIVKDDVYSLISNGQVVRPSDVSSGERNIIALCYFFVDIMKNLDKDKAYGQECFLVIDDPVSSFDLENRIGILSFLKSKLLKILCGNVNSKVLIMTHDLPTFYDMEKIMGELLKTANDIFGKNLTNYCIKELSQQNLIDFREKKRHEYTELISTVFNYANGDASEYDMVIGNVMRRMMEAFSTFEYKQGMDEISCDEQILNSLGNDVYHDYFQNLMYRLLLNGDSHMEEKVKSLTDPLFASTVSENEKIRTAKDIICFMYLLNKPHVEAHLKEIPTAVSIIQSWCSDILIEVGAS